MKHFNCQQVRLKLVAEQLRTSFGPSLMAHRKYYMSSSGLSPTSPSCVCLRHFSTIDYIIPLRCWDLLCSWRTYISLFIAQHFSSILPCRQLTWESAMLAEGKSMLNPITSQIKHQSLFDNNSKSRGKWYTIEGPFSYFRRVIFGCQKSVLECEDLWRKWGASWGGKLACVRQIMLD
jgi:hypothetical protein